MLEKTKHANSDWVQFCWAPVGYPNVYCIWNAQHEYMMCKCAGCINTVVQLLPRIPSNVGTFHWVNGVCAPFCAAMTPKLCPLRDDSRVGKYCGFVFANPSETFEKQSENARSKHFTEDMRNGLGNGWFLISEVWNGWLQGYKCLKCLPQTCGRHDRMRVVHCQHSEKPHPTANHVYRFLDSIMNKEQKFKFGGWNK